MFDLKASSPNAATEFEMRWGIKIPLRDGIQLHATIYLPSGLDAPAASILTLTPYVGQLWHDFASYFAAGGYPFVVVDVRGRGNSEGEFSPFVQEAHDGHDVVEWLATQPFCDGRVAMWGGSYAGYAQWATAKTRPLHLSTIVPVAAPCIGVDYPLRNNSLVPYVMQWLTLVSGRTSQDKLVWENNAFWRAKFRELHVSGAPFRNLDQIVGNPSQTFQGWISQSENEDYWKTYNLSPEEYSKLSLPILTITGIYDADQLGALAHHQRHLHNLPRDASADHYLVIGPWDHFGTRSPRTAFCGINVGPASVIDLPRLHLDWYEWTMKHGPRPAFLKDKVSYYVMEIDQWKHASTLDEITTHFCPLFLSSTCNPTDVFHSGVLSPTAAAGGPDWYVYDPRDISSADLESTVEPLLASHLPLVDQRMVLASTGKQLIYHSDPFEQDTEISGFFSLILWLSIDQLDTDFCAAVYEIDVSGTSQLLSTDWLRARNRDGLHQFKLIETQEPLRYSFDRFTFISKMVRHGSRLRLVIGPLNSIYAQKNYNGGGIVAEESIDAARTVNVRLFHDESHPSVLVVPYGKP